MNKTKLETGTALLFSLGVVVFLALLGAITLLRPNEDVSFYENRALAERPVWERESILDGSDFKQLDAYIQDHSAGRKTCLKLNLLLDLYLLHRPVVNNKIVVREGLLLPKNKYELPDAGKLAANAEAVAANLALHAEEVHAYGGELYYVAVPCQYVFYKDQYPWYLNSRAEYTELSSGLLFQKLEEKGVNYIDMRAEFARLGNRPEFSSTVDNHFGILGAYETYRALLDRINQVQGLDLEVLEEGDYTVEYLPNRYLGSRVRQLLGLWHSDEKLGLLLPNREVPFDRYDYENDNVKHTVYKLPATPEQDVLYELYMGGDISITELQTHREELPSILIYGDSFTNAVECIAYYSFDTMYSIDFRYYHTLSLSEFIERYQPEVVVCIRDYEAMLATGDNGQ